MFLFLHLIWSRDKIEPAVLVDFYAEDGESVFLERSADMMNWVPVSLPISSGAGTVRLFFSVWEVGYEQAQFFRLKEANSTGSEVTPSSLLGKSFSFQVWEDNVYLKFNSPSQAEVIFPSYTDYHMVVRWQAVQLDKNTLHLVVLYPDGFSDLITMQFDSLSSGICLYDVYFPLQQDLFNDTATKGSFQLDVFPYFDDWSPGSVNNMGLKTTDEAGIATTIYFLNEQNPQTDGDSSFDFSYTKWGKNTGAVIISFNDGEVIQIQLMFASISSGRYIKNRLTPGSEESFVEVGSFILN